MRWRRGRRPPAPEAAPTLVIPGGTRIEVDAHGQLSISAPGNLVIQHSGSYGTLESQAGSIRIEREVEVEAVTVRCAETCYVQGSLTAWKVVARALHLEDSARVHVVLQETRHLEVGRDARLVGGFASEGEIFGLFSRFAREVRALPFLGERRGDAAALAGSHPPDALPVAAAEAGAAAREAARPAASSEPAGGPPAPGTAWRPGAGATAGGDEPGEATLSGVAALALALTELPEPLLFALVLLEREAERRIHPRVAQRAMEETVKLLQEQDLETLRHTWRTLFGRIPQPREDAARARDLVAEYFTGGGDVS